LNQRRGTQFRDLTDADLAFPKNYTVGGGW
jgi:hypothetical protein